VKLLLDTHALIWWFAGNPKISQELRNQLNDPKVEVFVSGATAWELATKFRIGKLDVCEAFVRNLPNHLQSHGFLPLPVTVSHGLQAGLLDQAHKDPFDRMLAAQAIVEHLTLVIVDPCFVDFCVDTLW